MAGEIYQMNVLDGLIRVTKSPTNFFLKFFTRQINFETGKILFDKVLDERRRIAPYVLPNVQGRVLGREGYETMQFSPAYVKPKDVIDPSQVIERMAGESLGTGSYSLSQRRNILVADTLQKHRQRIENTWELLAAKAIIDGKVVISAEDYPETLVDFRRDASLTITLVGTAKWDQTGGTANPLADLKAARVAANGKSGARIQTMIFGGNAWDLFAARVDLKDLMDTRYGGSETKVTLISDGYEGVEYMGRVRGLNGAGAMECYVHTGKYIDLTGTEQYHLDQNTVVGVSPSVEGVRCFGAIMDAEVPGGYAVREIFSKNWVNKDPSVEYLLTQSAPLMVPKNPDATFSIKVA